MFQGIDGTGVYVKSSAEIKLVDSIISADKLTARAESTVSSQEQADAAGTTSTADSGVSVAVVDSSSRAFVSGASQLNIAGELTIEANNTITIASTVDGAASGDSGSGATLAVAVSHADTQAFISGNDLSTITSGPISIKATTTSTATSSATSTAGGADENKTAGSTKTQRCWLIR